MSGSHEPEAIVERAHAKLNVFLRVLGRRDDGDHDIQTVILPLDLHDPVAVTPAEAFAVTVTGPRAEELARAGGESLVARAAEAFRAATGIAPSVHVAIEKRIPVGAGMGGGSADAAALLRALGRLHPAATPALPEIAAAVGADVPALLHGGPVYADGRGDHVTPVHAVTTHWALAPFPFAVRTPDAYAWWDGEPSTGPDPGALIAALETGSLDLLGHAMFDDLQRVVVARHPPIASVIERFLDAGALGAVMTGSGPTVVALASSPLHADRIAAAVRGASVTSGPPPSAA